MKDPKELLDYNGSDRIVHFTEYLQIKEQEKKSSSIFRSQFTQFDEKLEGLMGGELTVISGSTGQGKTLFAESLMKGMLEASSELKACIFSFEVTPKALLEKYNGSPQMKIYLPLELKSANFQWLEDRVWESAIKENCRLIVFDHLHFLIDMAERQNMSLNIGRFMRELKWKIAVSLNVAIILIAHQKGVPKGEDPSLEDIRDSSFIAQEADNVILVWRRSNFSEKDLQGIKNPIIAEKISKRLLPRPNDPDEYSDQFAMIQIAKARRSGTFRWKKLFQKVGPWMEEV